MKVKMFTLQTVFVVGRSAFTQIETHTKEKRSKPATTISMQTAK